jgi:hypothetical protein
MVTPEIAEQGLYGVCPHNNKLDRVLETMRDRRTSWRFQTPPVSTVQSTLQLIVSDREA